jgi:hypothetical protein
MANIAQSRVWVMQTMQNVMRYPNTVPNPTFDIFLTGYIHYFNVDEDSECNKWSFGAIPWFVPGSHQPKLSYPLRRDLNNLVQEINNQYSLAVSDVNREIRPKGSTAHFVDISTFFDGHRFCEPSFSFTDQYYNRDIWIWNLSPNIPDGSVEDYPTINSTFSQGFVEEMFVGGLFNDSLGGIRMRPFHPTGGGHTAIANQILLAIKDAKLTGTIWE